MGSSVNMHRRVLGALTVESYFQPSSAKHKRNSTSPKKEGKRALKLSREQKAEKREGAGNILMGESTVFNLNDHHNQINLNSLKSQFPAH